MLMLKKTFIISSILLFGLLFFGGIYFFVFKKDSAPQDNSSSATSSTKVPATLEKSQTEEKKESSTSTTKSGEIVALTEEEVLAPVLTNDDLNIKYYAKKDGKVYKINTEGGEQQTISDKALVGLSGVFWSPDRTKAITKFKKPDGQIQFYLYDYSTSTGTPLKNGLDMVVWQNNSKIVYKYFDPDSKERTLNLSDADGKNWTQLTKLDLRDIFIAPIPKSGLVSFWNRPDAHTETILNSVSVLGGEPQILFKGYFGADYLWSNDGSYILVSSSDKKGGSKMNLSILNSKGEEYKNLDIPTMVSKCIWSKDDKTVYFALPSSIPNGAIMPNDYLSKKITTTDTFWKLDVTSGEKTRIVELEKIKSQLDATDLFLNSTESALFFTNRLDGKLYKINL